MKIKTIVLLSLLFGISCFLSMNDHSHSEINTYKSEISSDKAGYYIYLPAFFIYNFDASTFPDSIYNKSLSGFTIDHSKNKFFTKYTCGTAILECPFFLIFHALAKIKGIPANGFSDHYRPMMDFASSFYITFGLWFLFCFLRYYFDKITSMITCIVLFLGTHLYYYTIHEVGMSHIYSFFLFAVFLLYFKKDFKKDRLPM